EIVPTSRVFQPANQWIATPSFVDDQRSPNCRDLISEINCVHNGYGICHAMDMLMTKIQGLLRVVRRNVAQCILGHGHRPMEGISPKLQIRESCGIKIFSCTMT